MLTSQKLRWLIWWMELCDCHWLCGSWEIAGVPWAWTWVHAHTHIYIISTHICGHCFTQCHHFIWVMDIDINAHPELICHLNCLQKDYTMHLTLRQKIIAYMETEQWALFVKQMFIIRGMIIMPRFLFLFFLQRNMCLRYPRKEDIHR